MNNPLETDYTTYQPIGWAPECRDSDIGVDGREGVWVYNSKLCMMTNLSPSVANVAMMNKLSPILVTVPLDSLPTVQVTRCRDPYSPPLVPPPPSDYIDLGLEPWDARNMNYPPPPPSIHVRV